MKYLKFFIALFIFSVFVVVSCNKELDIESNLNDIELRNTNNISPTLNSRGVLEFNSFTHVDNYYNYLDSLVAFEGNIDSTLQVIENTLGFTSLRSLTLIDEFMDFSEMELSESDFVFDDIRKSMLNSNYEIAIGDTTYVYQNKDEIYAVLSTAEDVLNELRNLDKGNMLPDSLFTKKVRVISDRRVVKTNRDTLEPRNICLNSMSIKISKPCDPFKATVKVSSSKDGPEDFLVEINWGDGTPIENFTDSGAKSYTHNYSQEGGYKVSADVTYLCDLSGDSDNKTFHFGGECIGDKQHMTTWNVNGNVALGCEVWTVTDIFGAWAGAKAHSFKKYGSKWKKKRAKLDIHVRSKFRNDNCELEDNESDDDNCNWCKSVSVYVRENWSNKYHENGDVYGRAVGRISGVNLTQKTYLDFNCN